MEVVVVFETLPPKLLVTVIPFEGALTSVVGPFAPFRIDHCESGTGVRVVELHSELGASINGITVCGDGYGAPL